MNEFTHPGNDADSPAEIPLKGWKQIAIRVYKRVDEHNIWLVAAGVAFFAIMSIFPTLIAMISIYGLVSDPSTVESQINAMSGVLPGETRTLLSEQLKAIVTATKGSLSFGVVTSLIVTLWTITTGVSYLIAALNIVYGETETRSFIKLRIVALKLTAFIIFGVLISLACIAALPAFLAFAGLGTLTETVLRFSRWPLLAMGTVVFLAVINRYAPNRRDSKWRWVSVGSVLATVVWILASSLFSFYVSNFGNYNETYGSLATPIVLMTWLYLSSFLLLIGATVNAETEHQTTKDSTVGKTKPMGERGAYVADTLPASVAAKDKKDLTAKPPKSLIPNTPTA